MTPRILLLQARYPDDPMRPAERHSFADKTGLPLDHIVPHDLLEGPPALAAVRRFDALMIGGSGDLLVSERDLPEFDRLLEVLAEVVDGGPPVFASCFGFHLLVEALGGDIVHDPARTEVGTFTLTLTDEGRRDPILGHLPERFAAQLGRKDRAARLPRGAIHLAASERCPYQAFRYDGRPVWATQFHPELGHRENLERFENYLGKYEEHLPAAERARVRRRFRPSPQASELLPRFLELMFGLPAKRRAATG